MKIRSFCLKLLLFSLFLLPLQGSAQFVIWSKKGAEQIKDGTLAVVLRQVQERDIKAFKKKPEALAEYRVALEAFNANLKMAVQSEWRHSKEVIYVTEAEAEQIKKRRIVNISC